MAKTVLQIVQSAAPKLGIAVPTALFSSTDRTEVELRSVLNEVAKRIVLKHDWQVLKALETNTGDGSTEGFDLPSDYVRMPKDGEIWSSEWQQPLDLATSNEWLGLSVRQVDAVKGVYILIGGQIKFNPVLASGETAKWYYISGNFAVPASGANKGQFTADDDTFVLNDRVLELALIFEYRNRKGLDYAEDMANADDALQQAISEDKGARIVTQASRRKIYGRIAYPRNVGV